MEINENLEKTFTREEVEEALFYMGPLKSPVPIGLGPIIIKNSGI